MNIRANFMSAFVGNVQIYMPLLLMVTICLRLSVYSNDIL